MIMLSVLVGAILLFFAYREALKFYQQRQRLEGETQRLVETLADPREAAAILLVQTALYHEGQVSLNEKDQITSLMTAHFGASASEAEEFYSFGRMAVGQIGDAGDSLERLLRPIKGMLTLDEMKALITMMMEVAATDHRPAPEAVELIERARQSLKVDMAMHLPD